MKKTLLLSVILLLSVTWVVAQTSTQPTSPSGNNAPSNPSGASDQMGGQNSQEMGQGSQGQSSQNMGEETQVQGCLSGASGSYSITDSSGATWQLQGESSQLSKHVGQEVRLSGTASGSGASSAGTSGQTFNVTKIHKVANTCSNAAATPSK